MATVARVRAVGGRHDGGFVEDLGTSYQYVDPTDRLILTRHPGGYCIIGGSRSKAVRL